MGNHQSSPSNDRDTWKRVARDANHDECYDDADCGDDFRDHLGDAYVEQGPESFGRRSFEDVCRHEEDGTAVFQLKGAEVNGDPPDYLTRATTVEALVSQAALVAARAGKKPLTGEKENSITALKQRRTGRWDSLNAVSDRLIGRVSVPLAYPDSPRVFATFAAGDDQAPESGSKPGFWTEIADRADGDRLPSSSGDASTNGQDRRPETYADLAVRRLALDPDSDKRRTYLLLYYPRGPVAPCRYPTPPDAEFASRFQPVDPQAYDFGRTDPILQPGETIEDLAVPEVVHSNPPLPARQVWFCTLGTTSSSNS